MVNAVPIHLPHMTKRTLTVGLLLFAAMLAGCTNSTDDDVATLEGDSPAVETNDNSTAADPGNTGSSGGTGALNGTTGAEADQNSTGNQTVDEPVVEVIPPLFANTTGPYAGQALIPIRVSGSASGGMDPVNATCAWSVTGGSVAKATACTTTVIFDAGGEYAINLTVSDGTQNSTVSTFATVASPAPDGALGGNVFAYNDVVATSAGVSNVIGLATGTYPYPSGSGVGLSVRSAASSGPPLDAGTPVSFYILDADLALFAGPIASTGGADGSALRYDTKWAIPGDTPPGTYYIAPLAMIDGAGYWFQDADSDLFKAMEIMG